MTSYPGFVHHGDLARSQGGAGNRIPVASINTGYLAIALRSPQHIPAQYCHPLPGSTLDRHSFACKMLTDSGLQAYLSSMHEVIVEATKDEEEGNPSPL
jgi:hypothetical protein